MSMTIPIRTPQTPSGTRKESDVQSFSKCNGARTRIIMVLIIIFLLVVCIMGMIGSSMYFQTNYLPEMTSNHLDDSIPIHSVLNSENSKSYSTKESVTTNGILDENETNSQSESLRQEPPTKRLNIIVLYPDDWRHDSIGDIKPHVLTPFLHKLAKSGIRFAKNCVTTSICWMSRATLFTGQFSSQHQSYRLVCPHFTRPGHWNMTWPTLLQEHGYFVGHVGKWQYHNNVGKENLFPWSKIFEGTHWVGNTPASEKAKDFTIEFLRNRPKDKHFAITVAFYPPKPVGSSREPGGQWMPTNETRLLYDNVTIADVPYNMTQAFQTLPLFLQSSQTAAYQRWTERYRTPYNYQESMRNYYALITQVDMACQQIWEEVVAQNLENDTMIVFTTDNGMFHGAHGLAGKWYPYQESIRVPLIVYDPRMSEEMRGTVDDSYTLNIDLAETILGAANVEIPSTMQGRDISDLYLSNELTSSRSLVSNPWREEFFYEFPYHDPPFIPPSTALVQKEWKYIHWPKHDYEQLFHLGNDPLELHDLSGNSGFTDVLETMRKRHAELKNDIVRPNATDKLECGGRNMTL